MRYDLNFWVGLFSALAIVLVAPAAAATPRLVNGDMSQGSLSPTGWSSPFTQEGKLRLVRDTVEFAEAPAALRLESVAGVATGNVGLALPDAAGQAFVVTAMAKAALVDATYRQASLVLFMRDDTGKTIRWLELANLATSAEWRPVRARVSVPAEAVNTQLVVYLRGKGAVWLDEVEFHALEDAPPASPIITELDEPIGFDHSDWKNKAATAKSQANIEADTTRGGAGINGSWDLTGHETRSPSLRLRTTAKNQSKRLHLRLTDADGTAASWQFDLPDEAGRFESLLPKDAVALEEPNKLDKAGEIAGLDLTQIKQIQLQGEWKRDPISVVIDRIELLEATPELLAKRAAGVERRAQAEQRKREREAKQAQREAEELAAFLADVPRGPNAPQIVHIAPVAPDILGVTIDAGRVVFNEPRPYAPQPEDKFKRSDKTALGWKADGTIGTVHRSTILVRDKQQVGSVVEKTSTLLPHEHVEGDPLFTLTVDNAESYRIVSADDPTFRRGVEPVEVHRKSRVVNATRPERKVAMRHTVYLKLPAALQPGVRYTIEFPGVNTRRPSIDYVHRSDEHVTEALHVSQVGFRPDDPYKRGFLSIWLGTGGAQAFAPDTPFEVVRIDNGDVVYRGVAQLILAADQGESVRGGLNHNRTDVYELAFDNVTQPGEYRLHVPGIGTSPPFVIGPDTWAEGFRVSMEGFLTHRSGIELGPPFTDFVRPRNFHPADGARVYQVDTTTLNGESAAIDASFDGLLGSTRDASVLTEVPEGWGGYMDAGDWDRRSTHLYATLQHMKLMQLFPEYFATLRLNLPPQEADNHLPDLLDEALFNLDFYRRLQLADGGVRGGIESSAHPIAGEASWQESLMIGVFEPDELSSMNYAAAAAQAANLLIDIDSELAQTYRESALSAWEWGLRNWGKSINTVSENKQARILRRAWTAQVLAAVELYALTGERRFHDAFVTAIDGATTAKVQGRQLQDAWFTYAKLPASETDPALRERAVRTITALADRAVEFGDGNAFGVTSDEPGLPIIGYVGYYSTPGMGSPSLLYAHALTGDDRYLAAAIRACNSAVGANPGNRTYTTGLGHTYPQAPLHIDSRVTGQKPPRGITVYGPSDPAGNFAYNNWMHQYYLKDVVPESTTWPTSEAYMDTYGWPAMNEYTVNQTMAPTSFFFGYLAARAALDRPVSEPE